MFGKTRIFAVLLLGVLLILGGCGTKNAVFNGNKFTDAKEFGLEFSVLDTTYSHEMEVGNSEYIDVQIQVDAGNLNVEIRDDKGNLIYKGDHVSSGEFVVYAEKPGNHTFIVSGKKAKGYARFSIQEEIEPDTLEKSIPVEDSETAADKTVTLTLPILDEMDQNTTIGTSGAYMTAVQSAVKLLDWGTGTGLDPEEIKEAADLWLSDKEDVERTDFIKKLKSVDDAYQKLLKSDAETLLVSAGCKNSNYPWSDGPIESIEAIMEAAGLRNH